MEQRGIRLAGQDEDQSRGPEAERRPPERAIERERIERLGAGEDRDMCAGPKPP